MAGSSQIEWTEMTWNPVTGCTKVSQGCKHCYAERFAGRLQAMGNARYRNGFRVTLHEDLVELPLRWKQPKMIFVNSMSDLFHEEVPLDFIRRVFDTMNRCPRHIFQVLTKRSRRLSEMAPGLTWSANIWVGVSIEDKNALHRLPDLRQVDARVRFLSCEPLLGPLESLPLEGIDWVIVGGESGPGARPMRAEWVEDILRQCRSAGVPFFFKQWGGPHKKQAGRSLRGQIYNEMPHRIGQRTACERHTEMQFAGL
ncbi:MAG: phage Gp37/Gp68 family protein [Armatimonadetes bacterium]|nr:phage Gp37/Gp68 family protein [Armatimonadota bacterium]